MGEKICQREVKLTKKKLPAEGGKIGEKNCPRGVKLDKNVWGVTRKKCVLVGKKMLFFVRVVRKIPIFV